MPPYEPVRRRPAAAEPTRNARRRPAHADALLTLQRLQSARDVFNVAKRRPAFASSPWFGLDHSGPDVVAQL